MLLASVGLDKNIIFYDTNDKIIVKRIRSEFPFQSVSFCTDGHTIAIGASNSGAILVYDLRKSSKEVFKLCSGHTQTINSINFANKVASSRKHGGQNEHGSSKNRTVSGHGPSAKSAAHEESKPFKSLDQIKAEAKMLAEQKKQENLIKL